MLDNEHQCVSSDLGRVLKKLLVWPFYLSSEHWKKPLFSCREGERQRDSEETVWLWKVLHQEMCVLRLRPTQRATAKTSLYRNQREMACCSKRSSVFNHKVHSVCPQSGNIGCYLAVKKRIKEWRDKLFMTTTTCPTWQVYVRLVKHQNRLVRHSADTLASVSWLSVLCMLSKWVLFKRLFSIHTLVVTSKLKFTLG